MIQWRKFAGWTLSVCVAAGLTVVQPVWADESGTKDQPTFFQKLRRILQKNTNNQSDQKTSSQPSKKAEKKSETSQAKSDGAKVVDKARGRLHKMSDNLQKSIDRDKKNLLESGN